MPSLSIEETAYIAMKHDFEKTHCKLVEHGLYVRLNFKYDHDPSAYTVQILSKKDMIHSYGNKSYHTFINNKGETKYMMFIKKWMHDPGIRMYERADVYPNEKECPSNVFNIWTPFRMARFTDPYARDSTAIKLFTNYLFLLCGKNEKTQTYLTNWIAHLLQKPHEKSTMPIITAHRGFDEDQNNVLLRMLTLMIGEQKVCTSGNPAQYVFGPNNQLEMVNAYLVNLRWFMPSGKKQKALIYSPTISIKSKFTRSFEMKSVHKFIMFTDHASVKVPPADRRMVLIRADRMMNRPEFIQKLIDVIETPSSMQTIHHYLMKRVDLSHFHSDQEPDLSLTYDAEERNGGNESQVTGQKRMLSLDTTVISNKQCRTDHLDDEGKDETGETDNKEDDSV
jgi:hypothetical protein